MKLWFLTGRDEIKELESREENPWYDRYDQVHEILVRAENEVDARAIAAEYQSYVQKEAWLDPKFSSCEEITPDGLPGVIMIYDIRG